MNETENMQKVTDGAIYEKLQYLNETTEANYECFINEDGDYVLPLDGDGAVRIDDFYGMQSFLIDVLYICNRMKENIFYE